jgi:hypothetical protein
MEHFCPDDYHPAAGCFGGVGTEYKNACIQQVAVLQNIKFMFT